MSNALNEALAQAGELLKTVNTMIPQAEKLVNAGISEAAKTLEGNDLKYAQKKLMQINNIQSTIVNIKSFSRY